MPFTSKVTNDQRAKVIEMRRTATVREIAASTGLPVTTVWRIARGQPYDKNRAHRAAWAWGHKK